MDSVTEGGAARDPHRALSPLLNAFDDSRNDQIWLEHSRMCICFYVLLRATLFLFIIDQQRQQPKKKVGHIPSSSPQNTNSSNLRLFDVTVVLITAHRGRRTMTTEVSALHPRPRLQHIVLLWSAVYGFECVHCRVLGTIKICQF